MATRIIGILLSVALALGVGCKKAAAPEAKKNTSPRDALVELLQAMHEADPKKVATACRVTDDQRGVIDAGTEYTRAVYSFRDAIIKAYGEQAWDKFQDPKSRPGEHDATFIIITDRDLEKAAKMEIEEDGNKASCMMPTGAGRVRMIKLDNGTWTVDGTTFVPANQVGTELKKTIGELTEIVRKYQKAIGKPDITASDIDYEMGREIDFLILKRPDLSKHRFEIDKL